MKFTFGDSKKFANVHIFEAIKEEPDARVVEISGMVSWEKPSLLKGKRSSSFLRSVFIPAGFKVSDVTFVLTTFI